MLASCCALAFKTIFWEEPYATVDPTREKESYLRSKEKIRNRIDDRAKEAQRSKQRRAKNKEDNDVVGHKRVKVAESQQPETSLHSINFKSDTEDNIPLMAAAIGSSMVRRARGAGIPGEMALESIFV